MFTKYVLNWIKRKIGKRTIEKWLKMNKNWNAEKNIKKAQAIELDCKEQIHNGYTSTRNRHCSSASV